MVRILLISNQLSSSDIIFYPVLPNPTKRNINLRFILPRRSSASLTVYNILGQHVKNFFDRPMERGKYDLVWDGMDNKGKRVSSGTYFFMLKTEDVVVHRRVVIF
jgi:hypothetical protein